MVAFRVSSAGGCVTWQDSLWSANPERRRRRVVLEVRGENPRETSVTEGEGERRPRFQLL